MQQEQTVNIKRLCGLQTLKLLFLPQFYRKNIKSIKPMVPNVSRTSRLNFPGFSTLQLCESLNYRTWKREQFQHDSYFRSHFTRYKFKYFTNQFSSLRCIKNGRRLQLAAPYSQRHHRLCVTTLLRLDF